MLEAQLDYSQEGLLVPENGLGGGLGHLHEDLDNLSEENEGEMELRPAKLVSLYIFRRLWVQLVA